MRRQQRVRILVSMANKNITGILRAHGKHWVGDGFHVHGIFDYQHQADELSPFLLLDFAEGEYFEPTTKRRGVGKHPHRGFETVTIVFSGEAEHKDSGGNGGIIGPGDVQWMTAGSGIIHEEYHSQSFAESGGVFEVAQLWVNLPKEHKMAHPKYQSIIKENIPVITLDGALVRVIAGNLMNIQGPAKTFTPINLWNISMGAHTKVSLSVPKDHTTLVLVVRGNILVEEESVGPATVLMFDRENETLFFEGGDSEVVVLVMTGERIPEPVVGHGPFVMNSTQEIHEAIEDFEKGVFLR